MTKQSTKKTSSKKSNAKSAPTVKGEFRNEKKARTSDHGPIYQAKLPDGSLAQRRSPSGEYTHMLYAEMSDKSYRVVRFSNSESRLNSDKNRLEKAGEFKSGGKIKSLHITDKLTVVDQFAPVDQRAFGKRRTLREKTDTPKTPKPKSAKSAKSTEPKQKNGKLYDSKREAIAFAQSLGLDRQEAAKSVKHTAKGWKLTVAS